MNQTSDHATMQELGIHPGPVEQYKQVSAEPVDFARRTDGKWEALHEATWQQWPGSALERVEVVGLVVDAPADCHYEDLIELWRDERQARQEKKPRLNPGR